VSRYVPAFAGPGRVRVLRPGSPSPVAPPFGPPPDPLPEFDVVPAERELTLFDLLTHSGGLQSLLVEPRFRAPGTRADPRRVRAGPGRAGARLPGGPRLGVQQRGVVRRPVAGCGGGDRAGPGHGPADAAVRTAGHRVDGLRTRRPGGRDAAARPVPRRPGPAGDHVPLHVRGALGHCRGLPPLRRDAPERRRARGPSPAVPGRRPADDHQPGRVPVPRPQRPRAGTRYRLRPVRRGRGRPGRSRRVAARRHLRLGRRGQPAVLGGARRWVVDVPLRARHRCAESHRGGRAALDRARSRVGPNGTTWPFLLDTNRNITTVL
jgi:hypothetical protein